jgi:transmembrane sensor
MKKIISERLLEKYLKGECTPQEELHVKEWYYSFKDDADNLSSLNETQKRQLQERMYQHIAEKLATDKAFIPAGQKKYAVLKYVKYPAIAAAALYALYVLLPFQLAKKTLPAPVQQLITVTNNGKKIRMLVLKDGSHVWLEPGGRITYPALFGQTNRLLSMSGEAFFEVTKDPRKPFVITSGRIITKVWGTSFRVRDVRNETTAQVSVLTGKVSVSVPGALSINEKKPVAVNNSRIVLLYPHQQVEYLETDRKLHTGIKNEDGLQLWKKTNLSFDNTPVKDMIPLLNKAFGLNIHTSDKSLAAYFVTADLNELNFPEVMEVLRNTLNINYEIYGNNVLLIKGQ